MSPCNHQQSHLRSLDLPAEYEDLTGLLQTDLKAVVSALTDRATERLLLTRRESKQLRQTLWNRLADSLNQSLAPLSADRR